MEEPLPPIGISFITILLEEGSEPIVDLGSVDPMVAEFVLRSAAESVKASMVKPRVYLEGQLLFQDETYMFEIDSDEED